MSNPELIIKINANIKDFNAKLKETQKQTEDLSTALGKVGTVAGLSFAGIGALAVKMVSDFNKSQASINKLEQSLKNQNIYTKELSDSYKSMAKEIKSLTGASDDSIIAGQAMMQTFLGQTKITKELTKATVDFAVANKMDLETAFALVGKSIGTKVNPLAKQYGIELSNSMSVSEKMAVVTYELEKRFNDQAKMANEANKTFNEFNEAVDDVSKGIGEQLKPAMDLLVTTATDLLKWMSENEKVMKAVAGIVVTGLGFAGLTTLVISVSSAMVALNGVAIALGTTLTVLTGGLFAVVAGAGALIAILANSKQKPKTIEEATKAVEDLEKKIEDIRRRDPNGLALNNELYVTRNRLKFAKEELQSLIKAKEELDNKTKAGTELVKKEADARQKEIDEIKRIAKIKDDEEKKKEERIKKELADRKKLAEDLVDVGRTEMEKLDALRERRLQVAKGDADLRLKVEQDYQIKKLALEKETSDKLIELRKAEAEYEKELRDKQISQIGAGASNPLSAFKKGMSDDESANATMGALAGVGNSVAGGAEGARGMVSGLASSAVDMMIPGLGSAMKPLLDAFSQGPDATREMVQGFMDAIPDIISGFIEAIPVFVTEFADALPVVIDKLIEKIPDIVTALVQALPKVINALVMAGPKLVSAIISNVPMLISEFIRGLINGAGEFVKALINSINPFSSSGPLSFLGFAEGGQGIMKVPSGFSGDRFPAMLNSGEFVVRNDLTEKLENALDNGGIASDNTSDSAILSQILLELQKPLAVIEAEVEMGADKMADILLKIARSNLRTGR